MSENRKIELSTSTMLKAALIVLAIIFLYLVRDIVVLLFLAVVIVAAIDPAVDWFQRKNISRSIGTLLIYLILILVLGLAISFVIPNITSQLYDFSKNFDNYVDGGSPMENSNVVGGLLNFSNINDTFQKIANSTSNSFSQVTGRVFSTTVSVFSGLISAIVVFSLAFYMSVEENGIKKFIVSIVPQKHKEYAADLTDRAKVRMGKWMLGQLALAIIVFALDYIGLTLIGIPYALVLALLAGVFEIIPYVGPIVSAIPGIIIGFLISPIKGILAFLVYLLVQQLENNVIVPQIMKKAVGLNPVATIAAILIGFQLLGPLGAIIAVPAATAISLFVVDLIERH